MSYPTKAEINGEIYELNTSYKTALRCLEVINDNHIGDTERALAVCKLIYGFVPTTNADVFLDKAILFLSCGEKREEEVQKRNFDHNYDFKYVTASFASDYHIDLTKEDLHWWRYCELLSGLTRNSILCRVVEIRDYDLSEVKDAKSRAEILNAKESVALPILETEEEREIREEFEKNFE